MWNLFICKVWVQDETQLRDANVFILQMTLHLPDSDTVVCNNPKMATQLELML